MGSGLLQSTGAQSKQWAVGCVSIVMLMLQRLLLWRGELGHTPPSSRWHSDKFYMVLCSSYVMFQVCVPSVVSCSSF